MENQSKAIISRRSFITGAAATAATMGFFEFLPRVEGGYLAPALGRKTAYAAQDANFVDAHFTLTVVGADQVGFHLVDVSTLDEAGNGTPVPRCKVKVISRADSSKFVEGETDEEGKVIFDIGPLALRDSNNNLVQDIYQFNATVEVDGSKCRPVMRDFTAGLVHVEGASGIVIGMHALEDEDEKKGYIERFGFDDWDILYTKNKFTRSAENDIAHYVTVRVKELAVKPLTVKLIAKFTASVKNPWTGKYEDEEHEDSYSVDKTDWDSEKGQYTCMFTGSFLQVGHDHCFNADEVKLTFEYNYFDPDDNKAKRHKLTTVLHTELAPIQGTKYQSPMTPFLTGNGVLGSISAGNDWPIFNHADISIINWSWPVKLFYSPGALILSIGEDFTFIDDKGEDSPATWKNQASRNLKQRFDDTMDKYGGALEHWGERKPYRDKNKQELGHQWAGKFSIKLIIGVVFGIQFSEFKGEGANITKYFEGKACAGIGVDLKGGFTFRFTAGVVPFYVTVTVGLEVVFAGTFVLTEELVGDEDMDVNGIEWVPNGSLSLNIKPSFKLSVGVGMEGVISLSISGTVALPMYIGWLEAGKPDDADDTHFTVGYTFKAELSAQLICFSGSVSIWSKAENPFYDNWKDVTPPLPQATDASLWGEGAGARFLHTLPDGTKGHTTVLADDGRVLAGAGDSILDGLLPVTMEDMGASFEAEAVRGKQKVEFAEEDLPDVHRDMIPMVVELEDGTLVTQFVPCEGVNTFTFADELADSVMGLTPESVEDEETEGAEEAPAETPEETPEAGQETEGAGESVEGGEVAAEAETPEEASDGAALAGGLVPLEGEEDAAAEPAEEPAAEADAATEPAEEPAAGEGAAAEPAEEPATEPVPETPEDGGMLETQELETESQDDWALLGDPYLGFGAPSQGEYEYENVDGKTTGAVCGDGGVRAIGFHDGIKPDIDVVIYNEVFSDPRQKIVNIGGAPYLFRIMTVDYSFKDDANPIRRPRVVCSKFDTNTRMWGDPKVIEYSTGTNKIKRIDMFDYDFDIAVRSAGSSWTRHVEACLVITGGLRPKGDSTSVYEAFATPTVAIVFLDENLDVFQRSVKQASELYNDGLAHMVSTPRVRDGFGAGKASGAVAFAFLHRSADIPEHLMTSPTKVSFGLGYCYLRDGAVSVALKAGSIIDPDSDTPIYVDPIELDRSVTSMDIVVGEGVKGSYDALLTLLFYKTTGYEVCAATIPSGKSFASMEVKRCIVSSATLPQIAAWPGHGTFLFTKNRDATSDEVDPSDYYLYAAVFDPTAEGQAGFEDSCERVDFNGFKGSSFAVSPTGKFLFYYESFDGNPGDDINPETGEHTPVEEHIYRIMASRYMNGTFSEDFPFAELDSPIDGFQVMNITDDASTFLATEITDADHSMGRLRYIAVPNTLSAEIEAFDVFDSFVCAGKRCQFQIDIRNHGNLIIGGFDVAMFDSDGGMKMVGDPFEAQTIEPERVLVTASTRRPWMDDIQIPAEEAYAAAFRRAQDEALGLETQDADSDVTITEIMPGEVLSYRVEFDIPSAWRGKREVVLRLTNVWSPGVQIALNEPLTITHGEPVTAMLATSEGPVALYLHRGVLGSFEVETVEAADELIDPAEETLEEDDPEPQPQPKPQPEPEPKPIRRPTTIPDTGDPLAGIMAPLGAALGGFGALMGAYSARRAQIEREEGMVDVDEYDVIDE